MAQTVEVPPLPMTIVGGLIKEGRELRERGAYEAALKKLSEAETRDPQRADVIAEIAETYEAMKQKDKAAEQWRRIVEMGYTAGSFRATAEARLKPVEVLPMPVAPTPATDAPPRSSEEFARYAMKLREAAMTKLEPRISIPTTARTTTIAGAYQWRVDIITTTFWVGKSAGKNSMGNDSSCWDPNWAEHFGGFDDPKPAGRIAEKNDYRPRDFMPRLNPFYFALPYNDVTKDGTQPEARTCVPWFKTAFVKAGQSVLRDRWIAIRNRANGRIGYAQWSDCGPFRTGHWQYVFGNERPRPNAGGGAALSVSPSVRDFLGLEATDTTDWRFVEVREVPPGPWRRYGENNPFVQQARAGAKPTSD